MESPTSSTASQPIQNYIRTVIVITLVLVVPFLIWIQITMAGGTLKSWIEPTPMLSFLGLIVGFLLLSWQLDIQHRNTLEANRKQAQDKLKLDIYKELASRIEAAGPTLTRLYISPLIFSLKLQRQKDSHAHVISPYSPSQLMAQSDAANKAIVSLMTTLESYEVVSPDFSVFRLNLSQNAEQIQNSVAELYPLLIRHAGPNGDALIWPASEEDAKVLNERCESLQTVALDLTCVLWDLRVEAQNFFIGDLFPGQKALQRKPGDPNQLVTTLTESKKP